MIKELCVRGMEEQYRNFSWARVVLPTPGMGSVVLPVPIVQYRLTLLVIFQSTVF